MAATEIENDYVHLLLKRISEEKNVRIDYCIMNAADFERNFTKEPLNEAHISKIKDKNFDFIVIQLGENIRQEDIEKCGDDFKRQLVSFLDTFSDSTKIITLPF